MNYLYGPLEPTRLYIKQCPHCGLKYFGKSSGKNIEKYPGSGTYWLNHLKTHNVEPTHLWNSDWYTDTSIKRFALKFSSINNIVESKNWANQIPEDGMNGFSSEESKMIQTRRIENKTHHLLGPGLQKRLVEEGRHNTQNPEIRKMYSKTQMDLVEKGVHPFQLNDRKHIRKLVEEGKHIFQNKEFQENMKINVNERVKNGTHNFVGGDLQRKRLSEGTHHFQTNHPNKNKFQCTKTGKVSTKSGFTQSARSMGLDKWPHDLILL